MAAQSKADVLQLAVQATKISYEFYQSMSEKFAEPETFRMRRLVEAALYRVRQLGLTIRGQRHEDRVEARGCHASRLPRVVNMDPGREVGRRPSMSARPAEAMSRSADTPARSRHSASTRP